MKKKSNGPKMIVISYKVTEDIYKRFEKVAEIERDEAGAPLTASTAARRLAREALDRWEKEPKRK